MKRALIVVGVLVAGLALSGCGDTKTAEDYAEERVKLAKICEDGGGSYEYNGWEGYMCDFGRDDR